MLLSIETDQRFTIYAVSIVALAFASISTILLHKTYELERTINEYSHMSLVAENGILKDKILTCQKTLNTNNKLYREALLIAIERNEDLENHVRSLENRLQKYEEFES